MNHLLSTGRVGADASGPDTPGEPGIGRLGWRRRKRRYGLKPDVDDQLPSEAISEHFAGDPASPSSFPRVLRRRLDNFFSEGNISPKADRAMWVKIALGLAVLAGSWITLYALNPDSWKFVAVYLVNGLAQTFLLLNIA